MERVADEDDPSLDRDLLAGFAVGIALAVPTLVAPAHDRPHLGEAVDRLEDPLAELRVHLDDAPLVLRQRPRLEQDARRHADLADVVEERAELQPLQRRRVEAELAADAQRHVGDPARV